MAPQDDKKIALEILTKIKILNLPLKLDEITEGRGNCFPLSVIAQCRRPELFQQLDKQIQIIIERNDPTLLRKAVSSFMSNSKNQNVIKYKKRYDEILAPVDKSWREYWDNMTQNYEWVDYIFIQSTAWFLGHDILIITTTSTENHPFITISGNLLNENIPCQGIQLIIGSKSQVHYQSLLPLTLGLNERKFKAGHPENTLNLHASSSKSSNLDKKINLKEPYHTRFNINSMAEFPNLSPTKNKLFLQPPPTNGSKERQGMTRKQTKESNSDPKRNPEKGNNGAQNQNDGKTDFFYNQNGEILTFRLTSTKSVTCPKCGCNFQNIIIHLQKSRCKITTFDDFIKKFKHYKNETFANEKKDAQNRWKAKSISKQMEEDPKQVRDDQNKRKAKSRLKQKEEDPKKVNDDQNKSKAKS